jgi:tetratricopeptide (TPR) repeat protein
MKISKDKKKQILNDKNHLSINEISKKYNLSRSDVKNIIRASEKKTPRWFYAVLVLIPLLFLVLLELSLRIFNYGYDTHQWVDAGNGKYVINPEIGKRYFTNVNFIPSTTEDIFDQQKKPNAFRVFVLGGSSAAGYPFMPLGSFSRYIRKRLELVYPNTTIEVINISMTGVNSYTLLDLIPGVLNQKPDLILIYAGHNEYYGALGVGSMESLGSSRIFINLILYLSKFKTTQLVRNSINWVLALFSSGNKAKPSSTLMSRMAKDKYIVLNSEKFNAGIVQFRENLKDILNLIKEKGIPVILGRLVSNFKDQKPFISINTPEYKTADQVYEDAQLELKNHNIDKADSIFRLAKDLDALRFRAPEKVNEVINNLGKEYNIEIVPIDSIFDSASPDGIVGNNFIVDHLHPNLKGYQLIGKAFYNAMEKSGNLPKFENPKIPYARQDSLTKVDFIFTDLDSAIGRNIVALLKNDWPFVEEGRSQPTEDLFKTKNFIDSLALEYLEKKISWADVHLNAATSYLRRNDIEEYLKYINAIIYQYSTLKDFSSTLKYFYENNKINPADYTTKRLGIIDLYLGDYDKAINYLSESYKSNPGDTQILYNLALAYFRKENFKAALNTINTCLNISPNYPQANNLKQQLLNSTNNK